MNVHRVNAAAGAIDASMKQGKTIPAALAFDLEAMGLLQSPETAAELARLRDRVTELEAAARKAVGLPKYRDHFGDIWEERHGGSHLQLIELFGANRRVESGWYEEAATIRQDFGPLEEIAPSAPVAALRRVLPIEDPHDSPLHHDYRIGRDIPGARNA